MFTLRCVTFALAVILLNACQGTGPFTPLPGPMYGDFVVADQAVGNFSFTTSDRLLSGAGTLIHNSQTVPVAIAAVINGTQVTGTVANVNLGSGEFIGQFVGTGAATGTFSYTDAGGISTTSGTWRGEIE